MFIRRTRHYASIPILILAGASCTLAQSRPDPSPQLASQPTHDEAPAIQKALESVSSELRAIRAEAAQWRQDKKAGQLPYWANKLPEFLTFVVAGFGLGAAYRTLAQLRRQNDLAKRNATATVANARAAQSSAQAGKVSADTANASFLVDSAVAMSIGDLQGHHGETHRHR